MPYLYAVKMLIPGYLFAPVKIGYTDNLAKRKSSYHHGPFPVKWIGQWEGTKDDEAAIHEQFAEFRLTGEWFIPTEDLVRFVNGALIEKDLMGSFDEMVEGEMEQHSEETELEVRARLVAGLMPAGC